MSYKLHKGALFLGYEEVDIFPDKYDENVYSFYFDIIEINGFDNIYVPTHISVEDMTFYILKDYYLCKKHPAIYTDYYFRAIY